MIGSGTFSSSSSKADKLCKEHELVTSDKLLKVIWSSVYSKPTIGALTCTCTESMVLESGLIWLPQIDVEVWSVMTWMSTSSFEMESFKKVISCIGEGFLGKASTLTKS